MIVRDVDDDGRYVIKPPGAAYESYLLRIWRLRQQAGGQVWRLVLVSAHSGQEWHFSSLDTLLGFLQDNTREGPAAQGDDDDLDTPKWPA
jgi:hypothetical protein